MNSIQSVGLETLSSAMMTNLHFSHSHQAHEIASERGIFFPVKETAEANQ